MQKLADNILCWCGNPEAGAVQQAKNIDVVMEEQKDLVKILFKLSPMGVIKG